MGKVGAFLDVVIKSTIMLCLVLIFTIIPFSSVFTEKETFVQYFVGFIFGMLFIFVYDMAVKVYEKQKQNL
jgi:hypothetical protein